MRRCLLSVCFPFHSGAASSQDPLLNQDSMRETEIHQLCQSLRSRIETQNCQAQVYFCLANEHHMRAEMCARAQDKAGVRQFLLEKRKALREQRLELDQMGNLSTVLARLERAQRDYETGKHLGAVNMTLNQLLESMPDLADVMDQLHENVARADQHSEMLAAPFMGRAYFDNDDNDDDAIEAEVAALVEEQLPEAPHSVAAAKGDETKREGRSIALPN